MNRQQRRKAARTKDEPTIDLARLRAAARQAKEQEAARQRSAEERARKEALLAARARGLWLPGDEE